MWWRTTLSTNSTSKVNFQPLLNVPRCPHPPPQPQPMHGSESHGAHPSLFPSLPAAPAQPPRPQTLVPASPQRPDSRPGPSFLAHTVAHCSPESVHFCQLFAHQIKSTVLHPCSVAALPDAPYPAAPITSHPVVRPASTGSDPHLATLLCLHTC